MKLKCPECGKELKYSFWKLFGDGLVECLDCSIRIDILSGSIKPSVVNEAVSADTDSKTDGKDHGDTQPSSDEILPGCFYAVAVLVGIGLGITTIAVIGNGGSAEEIGYMIGYTIGGVLSILATGRLIELVRRISDDVRAIRERTDSQK
jgi:hypothetical protein